MDGWTALRAGCLGARGYAVQLKRVWQENVVLCCHSQLPRRPSAVTATR